MPQMAPISWLSLFFVFFLTFIIFNVMNYFCFNNKPFLSPSKNKSLLPSLNWKW